MLLTGVVGASLVVGDVSIGPATAWDAIFRNDPDRVEHVIVREGRLPRAIAALLVGAALAVAGAIMQAATRNPLASPGIMGLNAGAGFLTVLVVCLWSSVTRLELMGAAVAGSALAATLVYGLGSLSPAGLTPVRLALTGLAVTAVLGGVANGVVIALEKGQDVLFWFARGTEGVRWDDVGLFLPLAVAGSLGAMALARHIGALSLGEPIARGLGLRPRLAKFWAAAIVLALAGGAVSLAGPVGFIGLLVPHVVKHWVGLDYRRVILWSALSGGMLMLLADLVSRLATSPFKTPIPVGVITALIGVPYFLHLVNPPAADPRGGDE